MVKRLIGSGTTGTDGSCVIPYEGTGAGLVNLSVETEIDGSIVSETFSVIDGIYVDDTTHNTGVTVRMDRQTSSGNVVLTATGDSGHWIFKENNAVFDYPLIVEFDIIDVNKTVSNDSPALNVHSANNEDYYVWFDSIGHYKFLITKNGVVKLDGSQNFDVSGSRSTLASGSTDIKARLSFLLQHTGDTVTYNNVAIYYGEDDSDVTDWDLGANSIMMKDSNGVLYRNSSASLVAANLNKHGTDNNLYDWSYPVKIQFQVITMASVRTQLQVRALGTGTPSSPNGTQKAWDLNASSLGIRSGDIISIETTNGHWVLKINGTTKEDVTYDNSNYRIALLLNANNDFRFKDFTVTPL